MQPVRKHTFVGLLGALVLAAPLLAGAQQAAHDSHAAHGDTMTEAQVRKVDRDTKKITLRHGAIASLDMAPMTMVFQVADPAMLDTVAEGDTVRFMAERRRGALTVTHIEKRIIPSP